MTDSLSLYIHIKDKAVVSCSEPLLQIAQGSKVAGVFGKIDFIADFHNLRLFVPTDAQVIKIVTEFCASDDPLRDVHRLTELVGSFIVVIEQDNIATFIYSSGELQVPFYYGTSSNEIIIHTSWLEILNRLGQIEISRTDLAHFLRIASVPNHRTLFKHLGILKPYALYSVNWESIVLKTHSFPGFHTVNPVKPPRFEIDDYLRAVSSYKDVCDSFSLGYSGGSDSHMLACLYAENLNQLLTLHYKEPYADLQRNKERIAGRKAANKLGKKYTEVIVDFSCTERLSSYYRHWVYTNPFCAHLAIHYYVLAEHSDSQVILTGQNADGIWGLGLHQLTLSRRRSHSTSGAYIIDDVARCLKVPGSLKTKIRRIVTRYLSRLAMIHSFESLRCEGLIRLARGFGPEYHCLRVLPYKMFLLGQYVNFCTTEDTMSWVSAARYFSKKAVFPYSSPLALHVGSHIKRRHYFDLKAPFRALYSEFDPSLMKSEDGDHFHYRPWSQSPLFDELLNCALGQKLLSVRSELGIDKPNHPNRPYPLQELHLYHLLNIIGEQSGIPISGMV